ncbi:MAG: hypothetical protein B6D70_12495 [gamma proteobacterium symbiont of Stewartia floridana]|uniref:Uncharacterized protein n=1 Tax=Candidatus Thiodiazotropha taylori TaxID=2792791 RepID=A0A9E4P6P0_9GAMM|nr:hypothetical protein [Candidatus Thiodiazotropha taylori]MCG7962664.1 hypothetical protein [Candidatus Thiodiazotropha endolucinida]RLW51729.1 MAG: hypothetical protein B6D76_18450 [gamma proteobacterium symbiont of Stewartia floridana]MCG7893790.1 hypothetical protein [Candidatus Thiodiazotropha taylori]MCG7908117.1 hypothetical protein [Candidatus Thiodiazotropha taylori]
MNDLIKGRCWQCGHELQTADYGRESGCLACSKPTRVCRNCRWYAPDRPNQCEEPGVERVLDKEKANFCELFEPTMEPLTEKSTQSEDSLRQAAEDLFK